MTPARLSLSTPPASLTPSSPAPLNTRKVLTRIRLKSSDRKSTRLNSSHANISYAVFCLKKKKKKQKPDLKGTNNVDNSKTYICDYTLNDKTERKAMTLDNIPYISPMS